MGFGAQQVLRLGSNLILTRLLFPEAFGLMALASVFLQGLNMLSDIGVGPSIVQNKRGDDPDFLATAWTMQVIRGFALFLGMCALAYPASLIYDEPLLFPILLLIGTTAVITGFQSIGIATASRKMALGRLTMIDLVSQVCGITTMVVWAWLHPTVWALVAGGVIGSIVRVVLGHFVLESAGNKFHFEHSAAHEIFHFGKWIFLGTAMTYFGGQGIRLVQGMLVSTDVLGVISVAFVLGKLPEKLIKSLGGAVVFPLLADIVRERPSEARGKILHIRFRAFLLSAAPFTVMILCGNYIIEFLYDSRYVDAGAYLIILSFGSALAGQRALFGSILISHGDTYGHAIIKIFFAVGLVASVVLGHGIYGVYGMLLGASFFQFFCYPLEAWRLRRVGAWCPVFDMAVSFYYILIGTVSIIINF